MGVNEQSDAAVGCVFVNRFLFSQALCSMCLSCLFERNWRSKTTQDYDALFLQAEQLP